MATKAATTKSRTKTLTKRTTTRLVTTSAEETSTQTTFTTSAPTTTTTTSTTPLTTLPIPTSSLLAVPPLATNGPLAFYSAYNTSLLCDPTLLSCSIANPGGTFDYACGAQTTSGSCLTFLLFVGPGRSLCLGSSTDGSLVVRTCPRLAESTERRKKKRRRHKLIDRQFINGTGLTSQYWTIALFNPIPTDPTQRMLVNAGRSAAFGPNQGCLLRSSTSKTGDVSLGECAQPQTSAFTSTFFIPLASEPQPTIPPTPAAPLSGGAIAGIVIATLVTLGGMFGLTWYCVQRDRRLKKQELEAQQAKKKAEEEAARAAAEEAGVTPTTGASNANANNNRRSRDKRRQSAVSNPRPSMANDGERSMLGESITPSTTPAPAPPSPKKSSRAPKTPKQSNTALESDILDSYALPTVRQGTSALSLVVDEYSGLSSELGYPVSGYSGYSAGYGSDLQLVAMNSGVRSVPSGLTVTSTGSNMRNQNQYNGQYGGLYNNGQYNNLY